MSRSRKFLIIVGGIIAVPLLPLVLWIGYALVHGAVLQLMGYPVDIAPYELAAQIAEKGEDPLRCRQLQQSVPTMGPSLAEKRMSCFYHLASLTKDPTACELLMPSDYGWACVGSSQEKEPCSFSTYANPTVYGNGITATLQECIDGPRDKVLNECCLMAKIKYTDEDNDCTAISNESAFQDQCHHEMAIKEVDISSCVLIQNPNIRSACEVQVRALKQKRT